MIELFEFPPTRSQRAKWALEELALDYTSTVVDLSRGEQDTRDYRALQPLGVVPALRTDNYSMFESVAIVLQLIDEHPQRGLAPTPGSAQRAEYYQWCIFAGTELDPVIMQVFDNTMRPLAHMHPPGREHDPSLAERGREDFARRAECLSAVLEQRNYLLGDGFSGADIIVGHSCFMAAFTDLIGDYAVLVDYHQRLQQRPAYRRAYSG